MNRLHLLLCLALAGTVAFGGRASAQDVTGQSAPAPAYLSVISGSATLIRDGRAEAASSNLPLLEGDRLRTEAGRLEVFLPDGSLLHLDQNSTVDLLSASLVRLSSGRVIFVVSGRSDARPQFDYQVDASAGSVRIMRPGEYRVSLVAGRPGPDLEVAVVRGEAALATEHGSVTVRAGQVSTASDGYAPAYPETFNSARLDEFARWSADQLDAHLGYASRQYLPSEVQVYASTFDRYGTWETVEPYGSVWYPSAQVGWRPYYDGYWRTVGPYGWTWIGYDPWCWPTHHYGRWGIGARGWFWIPGRSWGAAWVSWGIGADYLSWCPLGWNNRPVLGLSVGFTYHGGRPYDAWSAWTVVPRHAFGTPTRVAAVAVRGDRLHAAARAGFAVQREGPPVQPRAAALRTTPVSPGAFSAGLSPRSAAVPRAQATAGGMPPRDTRPAAVPRYSGMGSSGGGDRAAISTPQRAPAAVPRSSESPITTYDRARGYALDRNVAASEPAARAERRSPQSLTDVAAETNASRRSPDPAQRDAGTRVYRSAPPDYRAASPQNSERAGGTAAIQRVPSESWSQGARSVPSAPTYERRAPQPLAAPRQPDRSWSTDSRPARASPAYERQAPAPAYQRQAPPAAYERQAPDRTAVPRAAERSWSPPSQVSQPSRPERVAPSSGGLAPPRSSPPAVQRAPQQAAPARPPGRGSAAGGGARKR